MNAPADPTLPAIATIDDLVEALRLLGVGVGVDETVPTLALELAYSTLAAAERNAASGTSTPVPPVPAPPNWPARRLTAPPAAATSTCSPCWNGARRAPPTRFKSSLTSQARAVRPSRF